MNGSSLDLPRLFAAVAARLSQERESLNTADPANHNHGDHMVEIFQVAAGAAAGGNSALGDPGSASSSGPTLAGAMEEAAGLLRRLPENGSAQVYARGLEQLAGQFRQRGIGLEDLAPYVQRTLQKRVAGVDLPEKDPSRSAEVLKALLNALAGWEKAEDGASPPSGSPPGGGAPQDSATGGLDLGYLFGVGMSYLQAKQKGGDALEVLAETVVSTSPLSRVPHRHQSGKIALRALLEAMGGSQVE